MSSVAGSIKQECPSCGGMITIKATLVGKKIDCPKCKFRFIVEGEDGAEEDTKSTKKSAVASKKSGKNGQAKGKKGGRVHEDDDEEADFKKKGEKEGSNKALLILAGVGVLLVVVVGIIIIVLATSGGGGSSVPSGPGPSARTGGGGESQPQPTETPEQAMDNLVAKLENPADADQAKSEVLAKLEGEDPAARDLAFAKLKEKALGGSAAALEVLRGAQASGKEEVKSKAGELVTEITEQLAKGTEGLKEDPTNMLPQDTQVVLNIPVRKFIDSSLGLAVLARGAFRLDDFDRRMGVEFKNVEQLVVSCNKDHGRSLAVVRTSDPFIWDDVIKAMQLDQRNKQVIKGKEAFPGKCDILNEFLRERMPPITALREKCLVHKHDDRTLLVGDEVTIKNWLNERPEFQVSPMAPPPDEALPGGAPAAGVGETGTTGGAGAPGAGAGIPPGVGGPGAGAGVPPGVGGPGAGAGIPPGVGGPGAGAGVPPGFGGPGAGAGVPPGFGGPMGMGMGPMGGMGPGTPTPPPAPAQITEKHYLTLPSKLRQVIAKAENKKPSLLLFAESASSKEAEPPAAKWHYFDQLAKNQVRQLEIVALALQIEDHLMLRVAASCKERRLASEIEKDLTAILRKAAKEELKDVLGFEFVVSSGQASAAGAASSAGGQFAPGGNFPMGGGGFPPGGNFPMGGGGFPPGGNFPMGGGGFPPGGNFPMGGGGFQPGGNFPMGGGGIGPPGLPPGGPGGGGGIGPPGLPPGGPGGFQPGGNFPMGGNVGGAGQPGGMNTEEPGESSTITVVRQDEFLIVTATVIDKTDAFVDSRVTPQVIRMRAEMDMSSGRMRLGDMPSSMSLYLSRFQDVFPLGAYKRKPDLARGGRPWPASERVSFLCELLPFLGDDRYYELHDALKREKSWRDPENARIGRVAVPHFLNPSTGNYYTKVRGIDHQMAVTHFVGMAGIGPDAPYYDSKDPRAGVFGYDRQASKSDITDGVSYTILLIQNDPALAGPWIAGGGSTVRGTSLNGDRDVGHRGGFISTDHNGKPGVWVMMADGSIRFLSKNVDPQMFKAMCTMAGGDSDAIGDLSAAAPEVKLPATPRPSQPPPQQRDQPKETTEPNKPTEPTTPTPPGTPTKKPPVEEEEEETPKKKPGG